MTIRVCLAGATGWAGSALAHGIAQSDDIELVAAVSRTHAKRILGDVLAEPRLDCPVYATAKEALSHPCDVFFEYTKPEVAKANCVTALEHRAHVVIGTSGLTDADYADIATIAESHERGVLAVGNFALTVVLLQKFAEMAAKYIPQWEIIDYAHDGKRDAPSGTARELAARLSRIRPSELTVPLEQIQGNVETRGARLNGSQIHSIRLPGYTISAEIIKKRLLCNWYDMDTARRLPTLGGRGSTGLPRSIDTHVRVRYASYYEIDRRHPTAADARTSRCAQAHA